MPKQPKYTWREYLAISTIITGLLVGIFLYQGYAKAKKSLRQYHCTDANMTYLKAQQLYIDGARYLDANGDGIACNSLKN